MENIINIAPKKIFTIILCAYNASSRIERAIESIIQQEGFEYLVEQFILVDNNSSDDTAEIMRKYEKNNSKVRYIFERNQGLSYARLAGVKQTRTDWIIFIDDDNILTPNWITEANKYILSHKNVGAFNGAVIPLLEFAATGEHYTNLRAVYKSLACTYVTKDAINLNQKNHPCEVPFGAGLVILNNPLQKLANQGWLVNVGRCGSDLGSGEDTEMCQFIRKSGYKFGYNPKMLIEHWIPKKRLEKRYLLRLWKSYALTEIDQWNQKNNFQKKVEIINKRYMNWKYLILYKFESDPFKKRKLLLDIYAIRIILNNFLSK